MMPDQTRQLAVVMSAALLTAAGCMMPTSQPPGPAVIGTLDVDGANAYLNDARAVAGVRVYDGDTVVTGPGTSVRVYLADGGYLQLDENTDPQFRLLREGACIVIQILRGQVFADAKRLCIQDSNLESTLGSRVNLRIAGNQSVLTVIEGSVKVTRPSRITLGQFEQYVVIAGRAARPRRLSRAQALAVAQWTEGYFNRPVQPGGWCCIGGSELSETTQEQCSNIRGVFYRDEVHARRSCTVTPPPPSLGWCCVDGSQLSRATPEQCKQSRGMFFGDEASARKRCTPRPTKRPLVGWCCINGSQLSRATPAQCKQSRGVFYGDEATASARCNVIP